MSFEYAKTDYTKEDLERFRDTNGFIDLDALNLSFPEESRERMGNPNREKNWISFNGEKALYKEEVMLDDKDNGTVYAELIVEELAKQVGIETARTDLVKKNGKKGILSYSILEEGEELHSLHSLIGDTKDSEEYFYVVDLIDMLKKTISVLGEEGNARENSESVVKNIEKRLAFDMYIMATDRHTENISLIMDKEGNLKNAPLYDNENSLMLDMDMEVLEKLASSPTSLKTSADFVDPKVALIPEDDGISESLWKDTLDLLSTDDDVSDFIAECFDRLDIEEAIDSVETKIHAEIPYVIKTVAINGFKYRKQEIDKLMCLSLDSQEIEDDVIDII